MRLSKDDQSDYNQLKEALLTNFDLTERSFRKQFRDCRPEKAEIFKQFSGRLASYLDKWLGLARVEKKSMRPFVIFWPRTSFSTVVVVNFTLNPSRLQPWVS